MEKIAVWLDHSEAKLITFENKVANTETINSGVETHIRIDGEGSESSRFGVGTTNNENRNNNRHSNELSGYYKALAGKLKSYDEILLFGPTNAKEQLKNMLVSDKSFSGKSIEIKSSDKLTPNQLVAFAREHMED